ncbi:MAG: PilZ domain-containing protein [Planctomycetota bacterium]|nr:PilZ domain-containing protein [Planctomycetaceae bacterium]MDQ3329772.1 PilZ domain-containing protein [Planctomycetota bacterium]
MTFVNLTDSDFSRLPPAPNALFALARQQFLASPAGDRRKSPRFFIAAEAVVRPLTPEGTPAGDAFRGVVADLSTGGMRLMHTEEVATPLLAVQFGLWEESVSLVLRVIRCRRRESHVEYSGAFLTPLRLRGHETQSDESTAACAPSSV